MIETDRLNDSPETQLKNTIDFVVDKGPKIIRNDGNLILSYRQAPLELLKDPMGVLPSFFAEQFPQTPSEIVEIRLLRYPNESSVTFTMQPNEEDNAPLVWTINIPSNGTLQGEFGRGYDKRGDLRLTEKDLNVAIAAVENSVPRERNKHDLKEAFLRRIRNLGWNSEQILSNLIAIDLAWESHLDQHRKSGEPYIDHPWEIVKDLLDNSDDPIDPDVIAAAWVHDILEDGDQLKQPKIDEDTGKAPKRHGVWITEKEEWLSKKIGKRAAGFAVLLTRPQPDGIEFKGKDVSNGKYYENLIQFPQTILIKMFDRLHNLRTLKFMPPENQKATIFSTMETYDLIFDLISTIYPKAYAYYKQEELKAIESLDL